MPAPAMWHTCNGPCGRPAAYTHTAPAHRPAAARACDRVWCGPEGVRGPRKLLLLLEPPAMPRGARRHADRVAIRARRRACACLPAAVGPRSSSPLLVLRPTHATACRSCGRAWRRCRWAHPLIPGAESAVRRAVLCGCGPWNGRRSHGCARHVRLSRSVPSSQTSQQTLPTMSARADAPFRAVEH